MSSRPAAIHRLDEGPKKIIMGLYAWPGAGKSVFLGTGGPKVLIGDCDIGGSASAGAQGSTASAVPISDYGDLEEIYQFLRSESTKEDPEFTFFWWDSATLFQDRTLIDELLADAYAQNPAKQDPDVPSQREYLKSQNKIGRYIRQFSELPRIHFGVTFHVMAHETPEGTVMWAPLLQGNKGEFSTKMYGYTNILGYYYSKVKDGEVVRYLRTRQNEEYVAKDRFDVLPPVMKNPTLPQIIEPCEEIIRNGFKKKGAPAPAKAATKKAVKKSAPRPAPAK